MNAPTHLHCDMSEPPEFEVDDAIILLLGAPSKSPALSNRLEGVTRLEKLLFLLNKETELGKLLTESPDFTAHNFGPFSAKSYQAIDTLVAAGLITDSMRRSNSMDDSWESKFLIGTNETDEYSTRDFELTELGQKYYRALVSELPTDIEEEIEKFKGKFGFLPLRQLVRYVYKEYPDYAQNSLIREEILKN